METSALYERAAAIRLVVFDCDGVLTDGRLWYDDHGVESKAFNVRDGAGIVHLLRAGIEVAVVSGRASGAMRRRAEELGIRHLVESCDDKLEALRGIQARTGIGDGATACVGDDLPDLPMLEAAGLSVCVADAAQALHEVVDWTTTAGGGRGAVREVCDLILAARARQA